MMVESIPAANKDPQDSLSHSYGLSRHSIDFTAFIGLLDMIEFAFDEGGEAACQSNLCVDSDEGPPSATHVSISEARAWIQVDRRILLLLVSSHLDVCSS
jgi:hypothetical protein